MIRHFDLLAIRNLSAVALWPHSPSALARARGYFGTIARYSAMRARDGGIALLEVAQSRTKNHRNFHNCGDFLTSFRQWNRELRSRLVRRCRIAVLVWEVGVRELIPLRVA